MKLNKYSQHFLLSGLMMAFMATPAQSEESENKALRLSDIEPISQKAELLLSQNLTQIKGIKVQPSETGLQIILETDSPTNLQPLIYTQDNLLVIEVLEAVLTEEFRVENPSNDITEIKATPLENDVIRITVTGKTGIPTAQVIPSETNLVLSLTAGDTATSPTEIEVVATQEARQETGYFVPNASVGTKTDTPILDTPQSIQVVPQEVLRDRNVRSIREGLENVSGVILTTAPAGSRNYFTIRGFADFTGFLVNGIPDPQINSDGSFINIDRIEVIKGPASVLYGQGPVGGTINLVTKQPLPDPFYEVSAVFGSFNDYQGAIDFSGPLDDSKKALYRLNMAYRNFGSFLDFDEGDSISIAPNVTVKVGENTNLVIEGDVNRLKRNAQQPEGQPAEGTVLFNPNGRVNRSFNPAGPQNDNITVNGRAGYRFEHKFNENWKFRNNFLYTFYNDDDSEGPLIYNENLQPDLRTLNRGFGIGSQFYDSYYLDTNALGNFLTGSVKHQLLFGVSLSRNISDFNYEFGTAQPVDIFNPVFDQNVTPSGIPTFVSSTTNTTIGLYVQDEIKFTDNLILLLGGRVDFFEQTTNNKVSETETNQSNTAFSPRVGIVYKPIPPISLYATFAQSFTPTIGVSASGNSFKPQRGTLYEIGVKGEINERIFTTFALYNLTRTNITTTDPNNPFFSVQTGEQRSRGIELDINGEILPGWNIIGGYAYTDAEVTADNNIPVGNRLRSAPEHSFNLWTTYRIQTGNLEGLGFGLGFFYVGAREGDLANTFTLPSYFRTDASVFYEKNQFRAALNISNLFDIDYYASADSRTRVNPGAPLTVVGTLSWQF
jgi:iron complex outermembrane receptor protein